MIHTLHMCVLLLQCVNIVTCVCKLVAAGFLLTKKLSYKLNHFVRTSQWHPGVAPVICLIGDCSVLSHLAAVKSFSVNVFNISRYCMFLLSLHLYVQVILLCMKS